MLIKESTRALRNILLLSLIFAIGGFITVLSARNHVYREDYFSLAPAVSEILPDQFKVEWNMYPGFNERTHYQVQLNHDLHGSSQKTTSKVVRGLAPGGTYEVAIVTYHEGTVAGVSSPTNILMPPATPEDIVVYDVGSASFKVIWKQVNSAEKYRVYQFPDILLAEVKKEQNKAEIHGLEPGAAFTIFVSAVNDTGESYRSKGTLVQLLPPPPAISIIEEEIGSTWFSMQWEPIENAISYTIIVNEEDLLTVPSDTLEYKVEGLATGTAVSVKIRAQNTSGASETSAPVIVQLLPEAPFLVATDISSYSVTLQWSVSNGATYYKIYLDKEWCLYNLPASINQVMITENISEGMVATYTVKAGNGTGESSHSQPVNVTFTSSSTVLLSTNSKMLSGLLYSKGTQLGRSMRGRPVVLVYFPKELEGCELALEATYLDRLAADERVKKIKFYAVFTNHITRAVKNKNSRIIWKRAPNTNKRYFLPGVLPLVKFYDSQGNLVSKSRVSIPVLSFEDILKELPEAIEVNDKMMELYREDKILFDELHDKNL